jgi:DNA-binding transcriptional MerR regulator
MTTHNFIGDVARRTGMSVKAIRYYEGLGLLAEPERSEAGYRLYSAGDEERLRFIKGGKALGLSLAELKEVLEVWGSGDRPCGHVQHLLQAKIAEIDRRVEELVSFRNDLAAYLVEAEAPEGVPCRHIAGAAAGDWTHTPPEAMSGPLERRARRAPAPCK